jgi:hypothetical protein
MTLGLQLIDSYSGALQPSNIVLGACRTMETCLRTDKSSYMTDETLLRRYLPFRCGFCAYLRRCYVAPVLYRTAAGRCGTILGAVVNDAARDLVGSSRVTVDVSCSTGAG